MTSKSGRDVDRDISGGLGGNVDLVMTLHNGEVIVEHMPVGVATTLLLFNDFDNGTTFKSGHIDYLGMIDAWGSSP